MVSFLIALLQFLEKLVSFLLGHSVVVGHRFPR